MRAPLVLMALALSACDRGAPPPVVPPPVASALPPPATVASAAPARLTSADVDARLHAEWTAAGVTPTPPASDATWLRRLWLDAAGTIPPPEVARRFLADPSADKRARMIDEVLASPAWADHWTAYWDDTWMGRDAKAPDVDRGAFRAWLHDVLARNVPWNEVVTQLVTASGLNSDGGPKKEAYANEGQGAPGEGVNGAVNWTLKYQQNPQDMAGTASRTLLGVQIQCAQCHDHKTEKWKQTDFQSFAAAFVRTRLVPIDKGKAMGEVKRVEVRDLGFAAPRFAKMADLAPLMKARPTALDGTDLTTSPDGVRVALARWITSKENPWFARALVNRLWGHFTGRGFVDPVDDLRPGNPTTAPELLDALAADFVASGYDVKHLVKVITGSAAYAVSAAPLGEASAKADPEVKRWERFRVTPLGPEELLNALVAATRLDAILRATGRMDLAQVRYRVKQRYGFLFDVDEESDAGDYEGTISQALALLDGGVTAAGASVLPGSALADIMAMPGDDAAKIETLYLRVLSRFPDKQETERWTAYVADAPSPPPVAPLKRKGKKGGKGQAPDPLRGLEERTAVEKGSARVHAYEDVLWALLNSSEFVLNH
ncbi:MAG: DUF1549 and DUF1553 domain-containing protein [Polyangiaceae bacterium]